MIYCMQMQIFFSKNSVFLWLSLSHSLPSLSILLSLSLLCIQRTMKTKQQQQKNRLLVELFTNHVKPNENERHTHRYKVKIKNTETGIDWTGAFNSWKTLKSWKTTRVKQHTIALDVYDKCQYTSVNLFGLGTWAEWVLVHATARDHIPPPYAVFHFIQFALNWQFVCVS